MNTGVVVIGRNEGERLRRCLESVKEISNQVIYVDSGSTDNSVVIAQNMGVKVLDLDTGIPFSAARARNTGFTWLIQHHPHVEFVQFIDGDCEIMQNWLHTAAQVLSTRSDIAIVTGLLNERFPEASIYNRVGDVEWNFSGIGEVKSVGGVFMVRRSAFESTGGFNITLTAGEEPELCQRLDQKGWLFLRIDKKMALHDLAMTCFSQWWTRQVRNGYGSLYVGERFGLTNFTRNNSRVKIWGIWLLALPVAGIIVGIAFGALAGWLSTLALLAIWPAQVVRVAIRNTHRVGSFSLALAYAFFVMAAYFPQMLGQAKYYMDQFRKQSNRLIEYKRPRRS